MSKSSESTGKLLLSEIIVFVWKLVVFTFQNSIAEVVGAIKTNGRVHSD